MVLSLSTFITSSHASCDALRASSICSFEPPPAITLSSCRSASASAARAASRRILRIARSLAPAASAMAIPKSLSFLILVSCSAVRDISRCRFSCARFASFEPLANSASAPTTVTSAVASNTYGLAFATALNARCATVAATVATVPPFFAAASAISAFCSAHVCKADTPSIRADSFCRLFCMAVSPCTTAIVACNLRCASSTSSVPTPISSSEPMTLSKAPPAVVMADKTVSRSLVSLASRCTSAVASPIASFSSPARLAKR